MIITPQNVNHMPHKNNTNPPTEIPSQGDNPTTTYID